MKLLGLSELEIKAVLKIIAGISRLSMASTNDGGAKNLNCWWRLHLGLTDF